MKSFFAVLLLLCGVCVLPAYGRAPNARKAFNLSAAVANTASGHSVTLTWTASITSTVTGYNVYRGTTAGSESATPLNASPVQSPYVDNTVAPLTTYFYVVKAFCPTCSPSLSIASNEPQANVPGDPQPAPPTGVTTASQ
jgi:hypothetical protein